AAVRAPTIGAVTPGRSRTQARATSSGVQPSPSAARDTASTMLRLRSVSSGSMKPLRCGEAPRESAGVPLRYLPVRMPRPSGDQGRMPMPQAAAAGTTSASGERLSREYSTWLVASRPRPGTARCQVAPRAVCQPDQLLTPTYDARPLLTATSSALRVSSTGVASD